MADTTTSTTNKPTPESQIDTIMANWSSTNKPFDAGNSGDSFFREVYHSLHSLNELLPLIYSILFSSSSNNFWVYNKSVGANASNFYWSDLTPAPKDKNIPKVGDTVVDLIGNVYSITASTPDGNSAHGGGIASYGPLLVNIAGNPDLSAYLKSADADTKYTTVDNFTNTLASYLLTQDANSYFVKKIDANATYQTKASNSSFWYTSSYGDPGTATDIFYTNISPAPTADKYPLVGDVLLDGNGYLYVINSVDTTYSKVSVKDSIGNYNFTNSSYVSDAISNAVDNLPNEYLSSTGYYNGDIDDLKTVGLYSLGSSSTGYPDAGGTLLVGYIKDNNTYTQLLIGSRGDMFYRISNPGMATWQSFIQVMDDNTIGTYLSSNGYKKTESVADETTASSSSSANLTTLYLVPEAS